MMQFTWSVSRIGKHIQWKVDLWLLRAWGGGTGGLSNS